MRYCTQYLLYPLFISLYFVSSFGFPHATPAENILKRQATWNRIPGGLQSITDGSAASTVVWGLIDSKIYRYTGPFSNPNGSPWLQIPGALSQISAGAGGNIWGLTSDSRIWRYTGDNSNSPWAQVTGALDSISVGRIDNIWGIFQGGVFRCTNCGSSPAPWVPIPGPAGVNLSQVSVAADATVWGVSADQRIWRYTGTGSSPWASVSGGLDLISVGSSTNVWGLFRGGIWRYTGGPDGSNPWVPIAGPASGGLTDLGVGSDGSVWGVNSTDQSIWQWSGN
ncbi:Tectonin 1 [Favolaschia claudopus]|uniref:Tectonin 1 n=1 Tax=Favolaschia claudopus TaxID=2862362 RepID=A0AAV9ZE96_9AGAR